MKDFFKPLLTFLRSLFLISPLSRAHVTLPTLITPNSVSKEQPLIAHDLTELRREALRILATPHGDEVVHIDDAVKMFVARRSHVAPHLYSDVIPCLQWLKEEVGVDIAVLTNGNAESLHLCETLGKYVSLSISATDVGVMKPSPVPFLAISQRTGVSPHRILFIGDSHDNDVLGAQAAGMNAALIVRGYDDTNTCARSGSGSGSGDDETVGDGNHKIILSSLMPDEFQRKVEIFLEKTSKAHSHSS
jgi:HAD superfamily hydrolase (TIGR01509 family)